VLAHAADLFGFYAGAAAGRADVTANQAAFGQFDEHATGWKVLVGIRPLSLIGAELEYADLGHPSTQTPLGSFPNLAAQADAHSRATTLSGLLYAPIPVPFLDLYGKAGFSRLRSDTHAVVICTATPTNPGCPPILPIAPFSLNETSTRFAYGAGAQLKVSALAVRVEYERINASEGNQGFLSVGLTWTF
jgi:opacity protein-like surface antigen